VEGAVEEVLPPQGNASLCPPLSVVATVPPYRQQS